MLLFFFPLSLFSFPTPLLLCADEALVYPGPGEWDASGLLYLSVPGQQQVSPVEGYTQHTREGAVKRDCPAFWQRDHNCLHHLKNRLKKA